MLGCENYFITEKNENISYSYVLNQLNIEYFEDNLKNIHITSNLSIKDFITKIKELGYKYPILINTIDPVIEGVIENSKMTLVRNINNINMDYPNIETVRVTNILF